MQDTNSIYGLLKESAEKYAGKTAVLYDTFAGSYEKLFRDVTNKAIHLQHFEEAGCTLRTVIIPVDCQFIWYYSGGKRCCAGGLLSAA